MSVDKDCKPEIKLDPRLSGNRSGPMGWDRSTMGPPPAFAPMPPGIPADPRYDEAQRTRRQIARLRAWALGLAISTTFVFAMFVASALRNARLTAELEAARRAPCAALALGLRGADNRLARVRDEAELRAVVGPMSTAIHPVLSACIPSAEASALAQQIAEARSPEQAQALIASAIERLTVR